MLFESVPKTLNRLAATPLVNVTQAFEPAEQRTMVPLFPTTYTLFASLPHTALNVLAVPRLIGWQVSDPARQRTITPSPTA